jgi:hypothetical protein
MNSTVVILAIGALLTGQPGGEQAAKPKAPTGVPRVLVMKDLTRRPVRLLSIGAEQVQVVGPRGKASTVLRRDVVAVLPDGPGEGVGSGSVGETKLVTVRGETLLGSLGPAGEGKDAGETVVWQSRRFGDVAFKLDDLAAVDLLPLEDSPGAAAPGEDVVRLVNGDRLRGFVESVGGAGDAGATLELEVEKKKRTLPIERVSRVEFSNPRKALAGTMIWLATGETLRVTKIAGTAADTTIVRDGKELLFPTEEIVGFVENAGAVLPLARFAPATTEPYGTRSVADPIEVGDIGVPLGAADVTLPAPMVVTWSLPEGAERISMRAVLPAACRVWGDCVLVVEQTGVKGIGGKELARVRLNGETPEADLNMELLTGGGPLRMTLDPGENGAIQDRVVLRQPLILVK